MIESDTQAGSVSEADTLLRKTRRLELCQIYMVFWTLEQYLSSAPS